jgi:plasmid stability protein
MTEVAKGSEFLIRSPWCDIMISTEETPGMAQFVVRNLDEEVKLRLQRRAALHGRSMEEEVRDILRNAVKEGEPRAGGLGSEIASLFARTGLETDIPELRGHVVKSATFDE